MRSSFGTWCAVVLLVGTMLIPGAALAEKKKTVIGDLTSPWFHVGGGPDFSAQPGFTPGGRFDLGGGFYTFLFTSGGGMSMTWDLVTPYTLTGYGTIGMAIPIPVFHPIFAFKGGGGLHLDGTTPTPHVMLGGQAGFILRQFDGKPGFRLMFEAEGIVKPATLDVYPRTTITFSLVL